MKRLLLLSIILLSACGPSQVEKEEIAIITCNIIGESRNTDGALRIREVNAAREKMGKSAFLETDDAITASIKYGLCPELVLNEPEYDQKLADAIKVERAMLESLKIEEQKRKEAAEKKAERLKNIDTMDFYELLKGSGALGTENSKLGQDNQYLLNLGSFKTLNDSENFKVELLLMDLPVSIESVKIKDGDTWHRVYVGPFANTSEMESARAKLASNNIDSLLIGAD
tara:strand:- start:60 stop:743 length:684 start_codon:yes stop_codon:yes gene_type:complete